MAELKIREVRKVVVTSGARLGQMDTLVIYMADNSKLNMLTIPKPDPSPAEVEAAIKDDWKKISALVGKTIQA